MVNTNALASDLKKLNPFRLCGKYFTRGYGPSTEILVILSLIACATACDTGISVPGVVHSCITVDSMTQQCQIDYSLFLSLDLLGSVACVTVVDSISSGVVMYTATLEYLVNKVFYSPFVWYYTSAWYWGYQTRTRCPGTDNCSINPDGKCPHIAGTGDRDMYGELTSSNLHTYGGLSRSDRATVQNMCFFSNPACIFSGWWFIPTGSIKTVYSLGLIDYQVTLRVTFDNGVDSGTVDIPLTPGSTSTFGDTSITLENYVPISNVLGDYYSHTVSSGGNLYAFQSDQVSLPSVPETFKIGDIQSSSSAALMNDFSQIIFSHDIVEYSGYDGAGAHYTALGAATSNLMNVNFPLLYGGNLWDYTISNSGLFELTSVYTNASFSNPIQLNIVVEDGVVYRTVTFSHLTAEFEQASGCYQCSQCAVATFTLASDGQSCAATVTSVDFSIEILTKSVVIGEESIHDISFCSTQQIGTTTFHFTCGQSQAQSTFDYILSAPVISLTDYYADKYYGDLEPISDSDSGFGLGLFDWLFEDHHLIFWLCLSAAAVVTVFLVFLCLWCLISSLISSVPSLLMAGYSKSE